MSISDTLLREIGREAIRFCRQCPAIEERARGNQTTYACHNRQCRLWAFLGVLGLRVGTDLEGLTEEELLRQAHACEARRFRGVLPAPAPGHDWEADARFHGLSPGPPSGGDKRTTQQEETRWRS